MESTLPTENFSKSQLIWNRLSSENKICQHHTHYSVAPPITNNMDVEARFTQLQRLSASYQISVVT